MTKGARQHSDPLSYSPDGNPAPPCSLGAQTRRNDAPSLQQASAFIAARPEQRLAALALPRDTSRNPRRQGSQDAEAEADERGRPNQMRSLSRSVLVAQWRPARD